MEATVRSQHSEDGVSAVLNLSLSTGCQASVNVGDAHAETDNAQHIPKLQLPIRSVYPSSESSRAR